MPAEFAKTLKEEKQLKKIGVIGWVTNYVAFLGAY
jgi:hypothetical protein